MQALAKYAFGLGTVTMVLSTLAFTIFALPVGHGIGTQILIKVFHAPAKLASIRSVDEAVVIGGALSLSSSAFVLQLLNERGEMSSKVGAATLGILLLQVSPITMHPSPSPLLLKPPVTALKLMLFCAPLILYAIMQA